MEKTQNFEPFPIETLTLFDRVCLGEINKKNCYELKQIDLQITSMSFGTLLKLLL
jgi:hypothetical protein